MEYEFRDSKLEQLAFDRSYTGGYPRDVVRAFRKRF